MLPQSKNHSDFVIRHSFVIRISSFVILLCGETRLAPSVVPDGSQRSFKAIARLDSAVEVIYYKNGGILPTVLRSFLA